MSPPKVRLIDSVFCAVLKANDLSALNQFKGFSIDSARLQVPAEADGTNLLANATLPNQSVLTLEIVSFLESLF